MDSLLNRGLNFSILPEKMDFTQLLVDHKRFARSAIWTEYHYGKDKLDNREPQIFKQVKSNLPKNYNVPENLKIFLSSIQSEISDPKNRNHEQCNLPPEEYAALKELCKLQKEKKIVIKPCDKGAGILILDYSEYMKACYSHLTSLQSENTPYYTKVDALEVERTQTKIENILQEGISNKIISKEEYDGMNAEGKEAGRFYCNFKVHKEHNFMEAPPVRPIISGSGSVTEGIGTFVNHHLKEIGTNHESYLEDTPNFLRIIEKINQGPDDLSNALLVTADVMALFTNIIHEEGMSCMREGLQKRKEPAVPTDFLMQLMQVILCNNIFEFHKSYYKQNVGAAMGGRPVPHYANIFMSSIDKNIKQLDKMQLLLLFKRFLMIISSYGKEPPNSYMHSLWK